MMSLLMAIAIVMMMMTTIQDDFDWQTANWSVGQLFSDIARRKDANALGWWEGMNRYDISFPG